MVARHNLKAEASAFNQRIQERKNVGFVPDLRRAVRCEYFYKSFWRDPYFINLYLGDIVNNFIRMLRRSGGRNLRILDVGCGAGYISLELARAGHQVVGIDISSSCIESARDTMKANPFKKGFGSLEYQVMPLSKARGNYDVILFSGVLHHFHNVEKAIYKAIELLSGNNGLILCHEPSHDIWRKDDAAQVALIRGILSLTGFWFEPDVAEDIRLNKNKLDSYIKDILIEYVTERDKHERGQSPNDNSVSGQKILRCLKKYFMEIEYKPSFSFIYRLLGGLRGSDEVVRKLADFLTIYDKVCVNQGLLRPNYFYFLGKKRSKNKSLSKLKGLK